MRVRDGGADRPLRPPFSRMAPQRVLLAVTGEEREDCVLAVSPATFTPILDRMERAAQIVRERLVRAAKMMEDAGVDYAVVGGNAVGFWVATVNEEAVRTTRDVDVMISRQHWSRLCEAMQAGGFVFRHAAGVDMFIDPNGPSKAVNAVHVIFAGERVSAKQIVPNPPLENAVEFEGIRVIGLAELVRMKLASWRLKDRVHLEDMKGVGLLDSVPPESLPPELRKRYASLGSDEDEG